MLCLRLSPRKDFTLRGQLTHSQCDEVKQDVADMFEECDIHTWPIDCFEIARKLHYVLRPYSSLSPEELIDAYNEDPDGFSKVEMNPETEMYQYVIYYNDATGNEGRIRWTIFHEIGHIYRGHHDNPDDSNSEIEEAEADLFAKYAIAPPPPIRYLKITRPEEIQDTFCTSLEASFNIMDYFWKRVQYGPRNMESFEIQIIRLFQVA